MAFYKIDELDPNAKYAQSLIVYEHSDPVRLQALLLCPDLENVDKEHITQNKQRRGKWSNHKKAIDAYMSKMDADGFVEVLLRRSSKSVYGRLYPAGEMSFCFMKREARNAVMADEWVDFDLACSHLSILTDVLMMYFPQENWEKLLYVRDNRESLCKKYNKDKQFWSALLYCKTTGVPDHEFFKNLLATIHRATSLISSKNPTLFNHVQHTAEAEDEGKEYKSVLGTFLYTYLSEIETRVIIDLLAYCQKETDLLKFQGKLPPVCSYEFDGLKLRKEAVDRRGSVAAVLAPRIGCMVVLEARMRGSESLRTG